MAKVYPNKSNNTTISSFSSASSNNSNYMSSRRETFTLWMKSLVFHGNGCTVFNSNGQIVYRIDNYNVRRSKEVHLMDSNGRALFSIRNRGALESLLKLLLCGQELTDSILGNSLLQKCRKVPVFGHWDGYKWNYDGVTGREIPWFQVKKIHNVCTGNNMNYYNVILGCTNQESSCYNIILGTTSIKFVNKDGRLVAEVKQKQASSGTPFGDDVLTLVVEPYVDHSLVMALVTVCGLIHHKI